MLLDVVDESERMWQRPPVSLVSRAHFGSLEKDLVRWRCDLTPFVRGTANVSSDARRIGVRISPSCYPGDRSLEDRRTPPAVLAASVPVAGRSMGASCSGGFRRER
jgi:hypothetical protein